MKKYTAVRGSHLSDADARRYGPEIDRIMEEEGHITPERVLEAARDPDSPLHDYFEWDDSEAAERYRRQQALEILHFINITVEVQPGAERTIRAFHRVLLQKESVFVDLQQAASTDEYRAQILRMAYIELRHFRNKYKDYKEFFELFHIIDTLEV